jgi:uncharacterized membrane protein
MIINPSMAPLVLLLFSTVGVYGSYLYGRETEKFRWREYFAMLSVPVLGSMFLAHFYGIKVIYYFFLSCVIGTVLEYIIGLAYHKTLNKRLWTYDRYSVHGYTSLLAFPMWGIAGVVFWLVSKSIGL